MNNTTRLRASGALLSVLLLGTSGLAFAQSVPIVQPGAPGQSSRSLSAEEATKLAAASYAPADVTFMQHMIVHHSQAVEMAVLVKERTNTEEIVAIAGRIESSQADEIAFMKEWLAERGEPVEDPMMKGHGAHMHHMMAGMASPEDMTALAAAKGVEFDRQFLTLMIAHHEGAVEMVEELLGQPGTAADPILYRFTGDIENEQTGEIERMDVLLAGLSEDPRAGLAAGFDNAGEAIMNLTKLASLSKPAGFFNPDNPSDLRPPAAPKKGDEDKAEAEAGAEAGAEVEAEAEVADAATEAAPERGEEETLTQFAERSPLLDFATTDMAFFDDIMVAGTTRIQHLQAAAGERAREVISGVGGQRAGAATSGKRVERPAELGCDRRRSEVSERPLGLRIFDISDLTPCSVGQCSPRQHTRRSSRRRTRNVYTRHGASRGRGTGRQRGHAANRAGFGDVMRFRGRFRSNAHVQSARLRSETAILRLVARRESCDDTVHPSNPSMARYHVFRAEDALGCGTASGIFEPASIPRWTRNEANLLLARSRLQNDHRDSQTKGRGRRRRRPTQDLGSTRSTTCDGSLISFALHFARTAEDKENRAIAQRLDILSGATCSGRRGKGLSVKGLSQTATIARIAFDRGPDR